MKLKFRLISLFFIAASISYGQVTVTGGAGGTDLVRSTASNGSKPSYTVLSDIIILESNVDDIKENQKKKKLILTAPLNWKFNKGVGSVRTGRGDDIKKIAIKVKETTIEIKLDTHKKKKGKDSIDEIIISGIEVQSIDGNITPATGEILRISEKPGNAKIKGIDEDVTSFGAVSTDPHSSMPVELVSFSADIHDNMVLLRWATATEENNYGFEVQRSVTEGEWEVTGFVEGNGNSNSPKEYEFIDDLSFLPDEMHSSKLEYRLKQIDLDGAYEYYGLGNPVYLESITSLGNELYPVEFELMQNYPNPFNPSTTIKFAIPASGNIILEVFNSVGQKVATLVNGRMSAGYHEVVWNAADMSSGLYIYRLSTQDFVSMKKMILIK